jgi:hypothetical protein|tara:strand:+ start:1745 stop:2071 length:327 start_codon:yes stop_codon:yes gene_type:complete
MILLVTNCGTKLWFTFDGQDRTFVQGYRSRFGWQEEAPISPRVAMVAPALLTREGWKVHPDSPLTVFEWRNLFNEETTDTRWEYHLSNTDKGIMLTGWPYSVTEHPTN